MPTIVPLSKGKHAVISDEDAERVLAYKWSYHGEGYACRNTYVRLADGTLARQKVMLHRFIVDAPASMDVDHENGDGLNCQLHNLRVATRAQNIANTGKRKGCAGQYKGVSFQRGRGKWRAEITVDRQRRHLGYFADAKAAARAYDQHAHAAWGEFAYLNFPDELHALPIPSSS
jgi:hypothetical protein